LPVANVGTDPFQLAKQAQSDAELAQAQAPQQASQQAAAQQASREQAPGGIFQK